MLCLLAANLMVLHVCREMELMCSDLQIIRFSSLLSLNLNEEKILHSRM